MTIGLDGAKVHFKGPILKYIDHELKADGFPRWSWSKAFKIGDLDVLDLGFAHSLERERYA